jgi:glutamine amidotransferase
MTIALIDYGAGNLTSVVKGLAAVGAEVRVVSAASELDRRQPIVVPGVGHFNVTAALGREWHEAVRAAIADRVPVLGICLGLQWLFEGSDEAPDERGLGLIAGRCFRLSGDVKVPHVGWNTLDVCRPESRLLAGLPPGSSAYFTHSYAAPVGADTVAVTSHGVPFAAATERDNTFGVQFHPEKSGQTGLKMLGNFMRVVRGDA